MVVLAFSEADAQSRAIRPVVGERGGAIRARTRA